MDSTKPLVDKWMQPGNLALVPPEDQQKMALALESQSRYDNEAKTDPAFRRIATALLNRIIDRIDVRDVSQDEEFMGYNKKIETGLNIGVSLGDGHGLIPISVRLSEWFQTWQMVKPMPMPFVAIRFDPVKNAHGVIVDRRISFLTY